MTTDNPGAIRPKSTLSFADAHQLDTELGRLEDELGRLVDFVSDLAATPGPDPRLRRLRRNLCAAQTQLSQAKPLSRELWNQAVEAQS